MFVKMFWLQFQWLIASQSNNLFGAGWSQQRKNKAVMLGWKGMPSASTDLGVTMPFVGQNDGDLTTRSNVNESQMAITIHASKYADVVSYAECALAGTNPNCPR